MNVLIVLDTYTSTISYRIPILNVKEGNEILDLIVDGAGLLLLIPGLPGNQLIDTRRVVYAKLES